MVGGDPSPFVGSEMRALLQIRIPPKADIEVTLYYRVQTASSLATQIELVMDELLEEITCLTDFQGSSHVVMENSVLCSEISNNR
jgi:hypothetical protein